MNNSKKRMLISTKVLLIQFLLLLTAMQMSNAKTVSNGYGLEEIVVTARKVEENLQQTGASVAAMSAAEIEKLGVDQATDLPNYIPNLVFTPRGGSSAFGSIIKIRGIGVSDVDYPTADPSVGVYVDGVFQARAFGPQLELFDLEHIEVLRGPQGALYGKNSLGGAINFITKKPNGEVGGHVSVNIGNHGRRNVAGAASMVLLENILFARFSGIFNNRDGFTENTTIGKEIGEEETAAARLAIGYLANKQLTIDFTSDALRQRQTPSPLFLNGVNESASLYIAANNASPLNPADYLIPVEVDESDIKHVASDYSVGFADTLPAGRGANGIAADDADFYGASLIVTWDARDNITFKSSTSYREYERYLANDLDGTPLPIVDQVYEDDGWHLTQEFQLNASFWHERVKVVGGFFASHEENYLEQTNPFYLNQLRDTGFDITLLRVTTLDSDALASYVHGLFHITDKLTLSTGLRYNYEKKFNTTKAGSLTLLISQLPFSASKEKTWESVQPKLGFDYIFSDTLFFYGLISKGFASGGFNPRVVISSNFIDEFDEEELWNFEIGFKSNWFDNRIRFNGTGFFMDYDNIVVQSFTSGAPGQPIGFFQENAGEAEVKGVEFEFVYQIMQTLSLSMGLGLLDQEFKEFGVDSSGNPIDPSDAHFFDSPATTSSVVINYNTSVGASGAEFGLTLGWSHKSRVYFDNSGLAQGERPGYSLVNARANYLFPNKKLSLSLWGDNLTNEVVLTRSLNVLGTALGFSTAQYSAPRTFGLSFKYSM